MWKASSGSGLFWIQTDINQIDGKKTLRRELLQEWKQEAALNYASAHTQPLFAMFGKIFGTEKLNEQAFNEAKTR